MYKLAMKTRNIGWGYNTISMSLNLKIIHKMH